MADKSVTPIVLGWKQEAYTGTKGQDVGSTRVVYIQCGNEECKHVFKRNLQSFHKYRASIRTRDGVLSIKAIKCAKCSAINRTADVSIKHIERYTEQPTIAPPHTDIATKLDERLAQIATLTEMHELLQAIKQLLEHQLTTLDAIRASSLVLSEALGPSKQ